MKVILRGIFSSLYTNKQSDHLISFIMYILLLTGLVFITSADISTGTTLMGVFKDVFKQVLILIASIMAYRFFSNNATEKNVRSWIKFAVLVVGALLIIAYFWSKYKGSFTDTYAWIYIYRFSLQPSEFAKIIIILVVASQLCDFDFKDTKLINILAYTVAVAIIYLFIIFALQNDNGTSLIFAMITCLALLIPTHKKLYVLQLLLIVLACVAVVLYFFCLTEEGYQFLLEHTTVTIANRFQAVKNPSYYSDATREIFYSLLGISKGNILGVGLGNSVQKFGYLVSSDADYIFAIIVEETGIIGITLVFGCYAVLLWRLIYYAKRVTKDYDRVILLGTASYLAIHFLFNVGGVSGLLPLTGVPLLLLSRGGTASIAVLSALGICQCVISQYHEEKNKQKRGVTQ